MENEIKELISYMREQKQELVSKREEVKELGKKKPEFYDKESEIYKDLFVGRDVKVKKEDDPSIEEEIHIDGEYVQKQREYNNILDIAKRNIEAKKNAIREMYKQNSKKVYDLNKDLSESYTKIKETRENLEGAKSNLAWLESTVLADRISYSLADVRITKDEKIKQSPDEIINSYNSTLANAQKRVEDLEESIAIQLAQIQVKQSRLANLLPDGKTPEDYLLDMQKMLKMVDELNFNNLDTTKADMEDILNPNQSPTGQNQTEQNQTGQNQTGQDQTGQNQTGQNQTEQNQTGQDQTGQNQTGQNQTGQNQTGQNQTEQDQTGQSQTEQNQTGQNQTGQNQTEQNQTGQDQTGQNQTGQNQTGQNQTGQNQTEQDQTGQSQTEQNQTGQNQTGQNQTGQNQTGQNQTGQNQTEQGQAGQGSEKFRQKVLSDLLLVTGITTDVTTGRITVNFNMSENGSVTIDLQETTKSGKMPTMKKIKKELKSRLKFDDRIVDPYVMYALEQATKKACEKLNIAISYEDIQKQFNIYENALNTPKSKDALKTNKDTDFIKYIKSEGAKPIKAGNKTYENVLKPIMRKAAESACVAIGDNIDIRTVPEKIKDAVTKPWKLVTRKIKLLTSGQNKEDKNHTPTKTSLEPTSQTNERSHTNMHGSYEIIVEDSSKREENQTQTSQEQTPPTKGENEPDPGQNSNVTKFHRGRRLQPVTPPPTKGENEPDPGQNSNVTKFHRGRRLQPVTPPPTKGENEPDPGQNSNVTKFHRGRCLQPVTPPPTKGEDLAHKQFCDTLQNSKNEDKSDKLGTLQTNGKTPSLTKKTIPNVRDASAKGGCDEHDEHD